MLKNISNLGSVLNKNEQISINGGIEMNFNCHEVFTEPCDNGDYNEYCVCVVS